jgi:hypothetical protein
MAPPKRGHRVCRGHAVTRGTRGESPLHQAKPRNASREPSPATVVRFDDIMDALKRLDGEAANSPNYGKFIKRAQRWKDLYRGEPPGLAVWAWCLRLRGLVAMACSSRPRSCKSCARTLDGGAGGGAARHSLPRSAPGLPKKFGGPLLKRHDLFLTRFSPRGGAAPGAPRGPAERAPAGVRRPRIHVAQWRMWL